MIRTMVVMVHRHSLASGLDLRRLCLTEPRAEALVWASCRASRARPRQEYVPDSPVDATHGGGAEEIDA
jgi:hypothetical protein